MAFVVGNKKRLNAVELVSVNDDAIDVANSDIDEYKKTGDVTKIKFIPNKVPTYFLCNFEYKGREAEGVKNSIIGGKDENGDPQITLGSWAFRVVKYSLKDIRNPPELAEDCRINYKKDAKGYTHDDTLVELDSHGLIDELFGFFTALKYAKPENQNAKN